jgi:hypothetical protein
VLFTRIIRRDNDSFVWVDWSCAVVFRVKPIAIDISIADESISLLLREQERTRRCFVLSDIFVAVAVAAAVVVVVQLDLDLQQVLVFQSALSGALCSGRVDKQPGRVLEGRSLCGHGVVRCAVLAALLSLPLPLPLLTAQRRQSVATSLRFLFLFLFLFLDAFPVSLFWGVSHFSFSPFLAKWVAQQDGEGGAAEHESNRALMNREPE